MTGQMKETREPGQRIALPLSKAGVIGTSAIVALVIYAAVTGEMWVAAGWGMATGLVFLFGLAVYFWGTLLFGGTLSAIRRSRPVPWSFGDIDAPEYDIDPGVEVLSAGVLAYFEGTPHFRPYFRQVPARGLLAIRPFLVARTGLACSRTFEFELIEMRGNVLFRQRIEHSLDGAPRLVVLPHPLALPTASAGADKSWGWRVRSGVTVLATFHFSLSDAAPQRGMTPDDTGSRLGDHSVDLRALLSELAAHESTGLHEETLQEGI